MDCPRLTRPWSCSGLQCILFFLTSFMETPFTHTTFAFSLFQELLNMVITFVKFLRLMNVLEFCLFWTKSIVKKVIIIFVTRKSILILYMSVEFSIIGIAIVHKEESIINMKGKGCLDCCTLTVWSIIVQGYLVMCWGHPSLL